MHDLCFMAFEMAMVGICDICGRPATTTCIICGKLVCGSCVDRESKVCVSCSHKREDFLPKV